MLSRRLGPTLFVLLCLVLVAIPVPATSNHTTTTNGHSIAFSDVNGNEWWVQAHLTASGASTVSKMEAQQTGSTSWVNLPKQSYGDWAASFHVNPGNEVRFRASWGDATQVTSCWFTHPAGVEQCTAPPPPPPPPPPPGTFDASFAMVRGNEWWVQAQVKANAGFTLQKVEVTLNNLDWKPLAKQSWGTSMYAASYHITQGTVLQLKATATSGNSDASVCYRWIPAQNNDATVVSCNQPAPNLEWHTHFVDGFTGYIGDMTAGDVDRDGKRELYVSAAEGIIQETSAGRAVVSTMAGAITTGDGDNDGQLDLYATGSDPATSQPTVRKLSWTGSAWVDTTIHTGPLYASYMAITVGDADNDGSREIYLARGYQGTAAVVRVAQTSAGWSDLAIADFGDDGKFLDPQHMWIGDGNADGRLDVVVDTGGYGYGSAYIVMKAASGWTFTRIGTPGSWGQGIVAGDVDGDGKGEVAAIGTEGDLHVYRFSAGAWSDQTLEGTGYGAMALFMGDGDNDGRQELYAGNTDGRIVKITLAPGTVMHQVIADFVVDSDMEGPHEILVADGDGDGRLEVYSDLHWFASNRAIVYKTALEPPFSATFSGVKGNEYWMEAVITANEPINYVFVYFDDCTSEPGDMTYHAEWGKWALGVHIPAGTKVVMEVGGEFGTVRSGGYIWPNATPTSGCP